MNNDILQLMQMLQSNTPMNQIMGAFGNNPIMQQVMTMMQGKSPDQLQTLVNNIAKGKGMDNNQLQQIAQMFGIRL